MNDFNPQIVAFICNRCSCAADRAGECRLEYPSGIKPVRVMCSGRMDPQLIMHAFREGADGVIVLGCRPGDCQYREGNVKAMKRFLILKELLEQFGIDRGRFRLEWISPEETELFQKIMIEISETIKSLGPLNLRGFVESEVP